MSKRPREAAATPEALREIGARLRKIRQLSGATQERVCAALGVAQPTWSKWESGQRVPDILVMIEFSARVRASLDVIYRGVLTGVHPGLRQLLLEQIPELVRDPVDTDQNADKVLASYRSATDLDPIP